MKFIYSTIFIFLFLFSNTLVKSQAVYAKGKIFGGNSSTTTITGMDFDPYNDYHVITGTFYDSVDVDQSQSRYTVFGGSSATGVFNSFMAYYDNSGNIQFATKFGNTTDSVRINAVKINSSTGYITAVGTFSGTVDFAGGGSPFYLTSTNGRDGFIIYYDYSGNFLAAAKLESTGNAVPTDVEFDGSGNIDVVGYFDNTIDMDPSANNVDFAATAKDGFFGKYDLNLSYMDSRIYPGPGNQIPTHLTMWGDEPIIGGHFTTSLDFDVTAGTIPAVNNGGSDVFLVWYDASFNIYSKINLGDLGNEYLDDFEVSNFGGFLILMDFEQTVDFDPSGNTVDLISAGGSDVAIARYDLNMNFGFAKRLGNSGTNRGFLLAKNQPGGGRQSQMEDDIMLAMSFSGSMDFDPSGNTQLQSSNNTTINSAIINLDSLGNYLFHGVIESSSIEAIKTTGFNGNDLILAGNFSGTNVDLHPYNDTSFINYSGPKAIYYIHVNRCRMTSNEPEIVEPFDCVNGNAKLSIQITGGAIYPLDYYWSNGDYYSNEEIPNDVYADNSNYYSVNVTDHYGCSVGDTIWVRNHQLGLELDATLSVTQTTCGNNFGSANVTPINALGNVSYYWSSGSINSNADSLIAGNYFVQVIDDSLFCYVEKTFVVENSNGPVITIDNSSNPTCGNLDNGTINVTVTGGISPYTYFWTNGSTSEDLSNVGGGTYTLIITDASGCENSICFTLTQPDEIFTYATGTFYSSCNLNSGALSVDSYGGYSPYTYQWDANAGFSTTNTVNNLFAGMYNVVVTDSLGCTASFNFGVTDGEWYSPTVYYNYITSPSCLGDIGYIDVYAYAYSPFQIMDFVWDSGETTQNLDEAESGKHLLQVTDDAGCRTVTEFWVNQQLPSAPTICMVTVDSTATQNVVVWDKSTTQEALYYNIYREGFCNQNDFGIVGTVDFDSLSVFYDTVVNSDTRSWRYYVTAVDTCGFESDGSEIHRTIHLTSFVDADTNIALSWSDYQGMDILGYKIYRKQPTGLIFDYVDSVSAITTNYLDTIDFDPYPEVVYFVDAIPADVCNATRAYNQNEARSNHTRNVAPKDTSTISISETLNETSIAVYPNPSNDLVNLKVNSDSKNWQYQLMDQTGRIVYSGMLQDRASFSTKEIAGGVYFIRLTSDKNEVHTMKLMIAH